MDRSRHTVTKYISLEKTHAAIKIKLFKKLDDVHNFLYQLELAKAQFEHKEPISDGFILLQNTKLRILEVYYNFFTKFSDVNELGELEMNTYFLYFVLAKELEDCNRAEMKAEWERLRSRDFSDSFNGDQV